MRNAAQSTLTRLERTQQKIEALATALLDEDRSVRRRAVQGLRKVGGERAVGPLGDALLEDEDPEVRVAAAHALGRILSNAAEDALTVAAADPDAKVREAASLALRRLQAL